MNHSAVKISLTYNNYLISLHDEGLELNIFDISNDFKVYLSFKLPNRLVNFYIKMNI